MDLKARRQALLDEIAKGEAAIKQRRAEIEMVSLQIVSIRGALALLDEMERSDAAESTEPPALQE